MPVTVSEFPAGTPNRLGMQYGCYILFGLATVAILLRIYARTCKFGLKRIGLDDAFVLGAWLSGVAVLAGVKLQFSSGIGWHAADIQRLPNGSDILKQVVLWPWVCQILYFFQLGCIKASIVSLYLRLTVVPAHRRVLWVALSVIFGQGLSSAIVVAGFICNPISIVWTGSNGGFGGPNCINILAFNYYNAAFFITTDILLAVAPVFTLQNSLMNPRRKLALTIMFGLGLLAIGGTISRRVTNQIAINDTSDLPWTWAPAELCSVLESCVGIIFISVPAMAPLFSCLGDSAKRKHQASARGRNVPDTIGNLRVKPMLRPYDESFLFDTRITAIDKNDNTTGREECTHEMDDIDHPKDYESERSILQGESASQGIRIHQNFRITSSRRGT